MNVNIITVSAFASTASALVRGQNYIAAASLGVAGFWALQSNDAVFYAVNRTHVASATTRASASSVSAAVVGLAGTGVIRCSRIILYVVQCNCTSEASASGQYVSAAAVGFASAINQIHADGVVASAIQSTVSARAYSTNNEVAAALGAATTSSLKGGNISIHVIRSNVTATASSSSSCAGGAGVAAWNPPDKLSAPAIISVCQSSVTAVSRATRAAAASYAQRLVVLDSRVQSKYCLFCDAAPSNTTLCNLDVSQCTAMGWPLKGNASGSANTIQLNNSVMTSKEVRSTFPGLAVADQCAIPLNDCPSVAAPSVVVPVVDFPLSPIPAIETATHWVSESTVIEPTSRSSTHSAPVTRSVSAATRRSLSLHASHSLPLSYTSTPTPSLSRQLGRATPVSSAQIAVLSSVVSESSARAVVASGVAASAVAGVFASPGAAVAATRIGMVLSSVDCRFNEDDTSPSLLQYPLTVGEGLPAHAIGVASACGLVLLFVGLGAAVSLGGRTRLLVLVRSVEAVLHQYCGPSMVSGAVLVARHSDSLAAVLSCCVCVCCEACVLLHRGRVVVWRVPREVQCERGPEGGRGTIKTRWVGELAEQYGAFFDMCRSDRLAVRVCFFVELCGSLLLGCVAGWRPTSGSCSGVAALMLVVATALFLYEVVLLPYRCVRDNAFGVIMGALQVAQCVCALLLTLDWMTSKVLLGWMALCQSCSLIAQLCLTLAWVSVLRARRQSAAALDSTPLSRTSLLDVPLQPRPPSASHNPLASNEGVATLSSP